MPFDFVVLVLLLLIVVLPIVRWVKKQQRRAEEEARWKNLCTRVAALERGFSDLRVAMRASGRIETQPADLHTDVLEAVGGPLPQTAETADEPAASAAQPRSAWQGYDEARRVADELIESFGKPGSARIPEQQAHSRFKRFKGGFDLEEALGTNWLNKIGIVILVFGIAFFLAYQLRELGPAGKVLVGWVVSGVLLGGGIFLERKPGYAMLGRAGIGGGWARLSSLPTPCTTSRPPTCSPRKASTWC